MLLFASSSATCATIGCATAAPFLWLLLVEFPSVLRDGRDFVAATSANVPSAGVDGLLARPLLVVVTVANATSCTAGIGVCFTLLSSLLAELSRLLLPALLATGFGSASGLPGSSWVGTAGGSLSGFGSFVGLGVETGTGTTSWGLACTPLGLLEATDDGRCFSALACVVACLTREAAGLGALVGIGDGTVGAFASGKFASTGDEVTEGGRPAVTPFFFLVWPFEDDVGSGFRFLDAGSGAGEFRGLVVFAFWALPPSAVVIARSVGVVPLTVFSTLRRLGGGLPLVVDIGVVMPRPTLARVSAVFRDLPAP